MHVRIVQQDPAFVNSDVGATPARPFNNLHVNGIEGASPERVQHPASGCLVEERNWMMKVFIVADFVVVNVHE